MKTDKLTLWQSFPAASPEEESNSLYLSPQESENKFSKEYFII